MTIAQVHSVLLLRLLYYTFEHKSEALTSEEHCAIETVYALGYAWWLDQKIRGWTASNAVSFQYVCIEPVR